MPSQGMGVWSIDTLCTGTNPIRKTHMELLQPKELLRRLRSLQPIINHFSPSLNYGGCAVFAACVGKALKSLGYEVECVVTGYESSEGIDRARDRIRRNRRSTGVTRNWNSAGVNFPHVGVRFKAGGKTYTFDSESLHELGDKLGKRKVTIIPGALTVEETESIASRACGWNRTFNRKDIPAISRIVEAAITH